MAAGDGAYYYFHTDGKMLIGWLNDGTNDYYMDPANGRMSTGWKQIENSYYYFNNSGHKLTGWIQINGTYYYLNPSDKGRMAANTTLKIDGVSYSFAANGACMTSNGNALSGSNPSNNTTPGSSSSGSSAPGSVTNTATGSVTPGSTNPTVSNAASTPGSSSSNKNSNNEYVASGPATGKNDPSFNGNTVNPSNNNTTPGAATAIPVLATMFCRPD